MLIIVAFPACSPSMEDVRGTSTSTNRARLTPFHTSTVTSTPTLPDSATFTSLPSQTPTLRTHIVEKDEDLGGIAYHYQISLAELMAANPEVDPRVMSVGIVLTIPASSDTSSEGIPSPTPIPVSLGEVHCSHTGDGGAWCFQQVRNDQSVDIEGVSTMIRIAGSNDDNMKSQVAITLLNKIPVGASLPLATYFPPPVPSSIQASAELLTVLPIPDNDQRYLPVHIQNQHVDISRECLVAKVSGEIVLESDDEKHAMQIWVAVIAYNLKKQVVGVRRWESSGPLGAGQSLPFEVSVYSVGESITSVEAFVEAHP